jgi:hypothetical protein
MNKQISSLPSSTHLLPVLVTLAILIASCDFRGFRQKPPCGQSVLKIGETTYTIKETKTTSDGSVKVPANQPDIAYWVNQTEVNHVFVLSPTPENLALQNTQPQEATVTWENCNSSTYTLSAPQAGVPGMTSLLDQSFSGITIFIQDDNNGFVIRGEFIGEEIQTFDTPDPSAIQAEISLLETVPSTDKKTLKVSVSIANYGQSAIALTADEVSLLVSGSAAAPLASEPALPKEIASGATETFAFTFAYPNTPGATLKVFSAEYELEGY